MFNVSQLAAFSSDAIFLDRDDGDLEKDVWCVYKVSIPCYSFHHDLISLLLCGQSLATNALKHLMDQLEERILQTDQLKNTSKHELKNSR